MLKSEVSLREDERIGELQDGWHDDRDIRLGEQRSSIKEELTN